MKLLISWDFHTGQPLEFTQNKAQTNKQKHPVKSRVTAAKHHLRMHNTSNLEVRMGYNRGRQHWVSPLSGQHLKLLWTRVHHNWAVLEARDIASIYSYNLPDYFQHDDTPCNKAELISDLNMTVGSLVPPPVTRSQSNHKNPGTGDLECEC